MVTTTRSCLCPDPPLHGNPSGPSYAQKMRCPSPEPIRGPCCSCDRIQLLGGVHRDPEISSPPSHLNPNLGSSPTRQQVPLEVFHLTQLRSFAHTAPSAWTSLRSHLSLQSCRKPFPRPQADRSASLGLPSVASAPIAGPATLAGLSVQEFLEVWGTEFCKASTGLGPGVGLAGVR